MKKQFSFKWKKSKQTRKQRKYLANAPLHIKRRLFGSNLSKELRKKYLKRSMPVRKGDEVKIMVGKFRGKTGKVSIANIKKGVVAIEGIQKQKKDGTKINVYFHPSNLQIIKLDVDDKMREKALKRKPSAKKENKENK